MTIDMIAIAPDARKNSPATTVLDHTGYWLLALSCLLAIPTLHLVMVAGGIHEALARSVDLAWQGSFWGIQNRVLGQILMDTPLFMVIAAMAWAYWQAACQWQKVTLSDSEARRWLKHLFLWTIVIGVVLMLVVPFHSRDVYGYINRGVQQAFYALNPYVTPLDQIPGWQDDPMFHAHWASNPSPYGFFFTGLTKLVLMLSGKNFVLAFLAFKGLSLLAHLGCVWLIYLLSLRLQLARPWLNAALYALNPLILLQMSANGHNDLLLSLPLMAGLAILLVPGRLWLALPLITISVLTKYASVMAMPFVVLLLLLQRRWLALVLGVFVSLLLLVIFAQPYVGEMARMPAAMMAENAGLSQHSLNAMIGRMMFYLAKVLPVLKPAVEQTRSFLKWVCYGGFAAGYIYALWRFFKATPKLQYGGSHQAVFRLRCGNRFIR